MKLKSSLILLLLGLFFLPSFSDAAFRYSNCLHYGQGYNTTESGTLIGTVLSTTGTISQVDSSISDCQEFDFDLVMTIPSYDRTHLNIFSPDLDIILFGIFDGDNSYLTDDLTNDGVDARSLSFDITSLADGNYSSCSQNDGLICTPFYVVNGLLYMDVNDIPVIVATTTSTIESSVGSLNFGVAILIVLCSLFVISFIYTQMKGKGKPWSH